MTGDPLDQEARRAIGGWVDEPKGPGLAYGLVWAICTAGSFGLLLLAAWLLIA